MLTQREFDFIRDFLRDLGTLELLGLGGAIANGGPLYISNSTLSGNSAVNSEGGGIANEGTLKITGSTLSGNSAKGYPAYGDGDGGGIFNWAGNVSIANSTFSGNSAKHYGGGIYSQPFNGGGPVISGSVDVSNSTFTGNTAGAGGGLFNYDTSTGVSVKSSIIAQNASFFGVDVSGLFISGGFNLIGETDGNTNFNQATDLAGDIGSVIDPKFDPNGLKDNGGPTQTIALLAGSPAIDKGTSDGLTTDQRGPGFTRSYHDPTVQSTGGDGTDIGAFELQPAKPSPCNPPPSGMIAWFPGDNNADDIVGTNNGTLISGAGFGPGEADVKQAFAFPGGDAAVRLPSGVLDQSFTAVTLDAWIKPSATGHDSTGALGQTIYHNEDVGFALRIKDGFLQPDVRTTGQVVFQTFGPALHLNQWSHVAMTYDGTQVSAYLNGQLVGSAPATGDIIPSGNPNTCPMIGNEPDACLPRQSGFGFQGSVDELQIFDRALSLAEIQTIYNTGSGGGCQSNTLVGPNVTVQPSGAVAISFASVSRAGYTSVTQIDPSSAGTLPGGYEVFDNLAFDVTTTARVSGPIQTCFNVPSANDSAVFSNLRVFHKEGSLVDRTILSPDSLAPDFAAHTICARTDSLSPFVIAQLVNRAPVAKAKNIQVSANNSCQANVTAQQVDNGSYDPDTGDSITLSLDNYGPFSLGPHQVTLTATDSHGAANSAVATVTVVDTTPPTVTAPAPTSAYSDINCQAMVPNVLPQVIASDACGGVTLSQSPTAGTLVGVGPHTIIITAKDGSNNSNSAATTFTVIAGPSFTVSVTPNNVKRGGSVTLNAAFNNCANSSQALTLKVSLTRPGSNTLIVTLPLTLKAGQKGSISIPVPISKSTPTGLYSLTLDVYVGGVRIGTSTAQLTVTA